MDWDDFWDDDDEGDLRPVKLAPVENDDNCCYSEIPCGDAAHDPHVRQQDRG